MSIDGNKRLVRKFIEEIINTGNVENIEAFIAPGYTEVHNGKRYHLGIDGAKAHVTGVRKTYPDLQLTVERQIGEGDWVATCITARGTHKGLWLGIKPTNKPVAYSGVNINKVVNAKIVEHGGAANMLGPLLQIGAVKVVGESTEI